MREIKIKNIKNIPSEPVYDIEVGDHGHYILGNGIISHNSMGSMYSSTQSAGGCLTAGHKIKMANNTLKTIESICISDVVMTTDGPKLVEDFHSFENKETIELSFEDGSSITCTPEHEFLIESDDGCIWIEAKNLNIGSDVLEV